VWWIKVISFTGYFFFLVYFVLGLIISRFSRLGWYNRRFFFLKL
jgi:hypothetical protein